MASKLIDNIETNDMNFKHLETTKDIVISPKNEYGDPQRPDSTHTWTAKVSDGTNFVGDYAVKLNGTSLIVDSEDFTKLPIGKYELEVWEQWTDPDGTSELSIYPSPKQTIPFTIYANIADQAEAEIKKIGFQDVVDQAVMNIGMNYVFKVNTIEPDQNATVVQSAADGKNYVTFNIPRGQTGEQGFRGPAGKNFQIKQTFASIKAMTDSQGNGFDDGDFALIASNTQDPDNSKLYVWNSDKKQFIFMSDLSGAQGIQGPHGPAPTLHVTKVTGLPAGSQPTFTAVPAGNGNYNVEVGIPKGDKGDKGDTGTVDNNGLITSQAFQGLQAQVNNSAVGTNLLTNTGDLSANWTGYSSISTTAEYNGHPSMVFAPSAQRQLASQNLVLGNLQNSTQYTASFWAKADNAGDKAHTELWGSNGATDFVLTTNWARYTAVLTSLPDANTNILHSVYYIWAPDGNKGNVYIAEPKLEKGSVATDWCPNPSEILTQSDYAKIKAAIVALGGALS